jgi:glycosyltransferase involved in cell wall biosynthesis
VVLHVFGGGPLQEELQGQAAGDDGIAFHGNTRSAPSYMRHMHALLLTSEHEGLPVSVLEAMALQLPVVATNTGGLPQLLCEGSCGWLVQSGHVDGYAQALVEATQPGADRTARVSKAVARSESDFSARRMAEDYLAAYRSLAILTSGARGRRPA